MNRTIKLLMISDIFVLTGFGLIQPILAIFFKENLQGGTIFAAGFASTLFLITKSFVQLPFSRYVDLHKDNLKWLILGTFLISTVPFIYLCATRVELIYIAQVVYGIGSGFAYATWLKLWSKNLDNKKESFQWSLYSTLTGLGSAATAAIGGAFAQQFGFQLTFIMTGVMSLLGCSVLFFLDIKDKKKCQTSLHDYVLRRKLSH